VALTAEEAGYADDPARTAAHLEALARTRFGEPLPSGTTATSPVPMVGDAIPWRWLFVGVLALWVLTLVAWIAVARRHRSRKPAAAPADAETPLRERAAHKRFLEVAAGSDPAAIERGLLQWARTVRPTVRSLGGLSGELRDGPQTQAIVALQRARFADGPAPGAALREAFAKGFDWKVSPPADSAPGLPPLYPR
jgi:hypothetical protein